MRINGGWHTPEVLNVKEQEVKTMRSFPLMYFIRKVVQERVARRDEHGASVL